MHAFAYYHKPAELSLTNEYEQLIVSLGTMIIEQALSMSPSCSFVKTRIKP